MSSNSLHTLLGAVQPGLVILAVTAVILSGVLTVLVVLSTVVAIFGGPEKGERARLVLCHLLAVVFRDGDR